MLEFAWSCEADARRQAAEDASLASARIRDLQSRLAAAQRNAAQVHA